MHKDMIPHTNKKEIQKPILSARSVFFETIMIPHHKFAMSFAGAGIILLSLPAFGLPLFSGTASVNTPWQQVDSTTSNSGSSPVQGDDSLAPILSPEGVLSPNVFSQYSAGVATGTMTVHAESPGNIDYWYSTWASAGTDWQEPLAIASQSLAIGTPIHIRPVVSVIGLPSVFYQHVSDSTTAVTFSVDLNSTLGSMYSYNLRPNAESSNAPTLTVPDRTIAVGQSLFLDFGAGLTASATRGGGQASPLIPVSLTSSMSATLLGFSFSDSQGNPLTDITVTTSSPDGTQSILPTLLPGDANADGKVDLNDLNIVLNNLGATTPN